jgi:hypothetical protein
MKKGKFFKYPEPNNKRIFELKKKVGYKYHFKCGHWVMDSVFNDMIDLSTGLAEWQKPKQLKLF